jgi:hypothetical protein
MRGILRSTALIDTWFDMLPASQAPLARALHAAIMAAQPRLVPTVKWGNLVYMLNGLNLLAIMVHKTHANLQVFNGAVLAERFPELEGTGKGIRHLKCRAGMPLDLETIDMLVKSSVEIATLDRE